MLKLTLHCEKYFLSDNHENIFSVFNKCMHCNIYTETIFPMIIIIIEKFMYIWTGTFNATKNEYLCKYNAVKPTTFNTEALYLHNCDPYLRNINIEYVILTCLKQV